ncbi:hypothetical protein Mal15_64220 [Stieleria maiorica]|uniref:GmrSD restriction endonucleases N-terminal domain-containing protein n=1 Tax=Stieleria maiorica TaxID=2795974 RepID=A0A5B9MR36_9BACT|nr:DUF262 domain-containing protein [Stieleria maiorica]QEG02335.1 hypothetical protein Mal15_64220 [Stieleria maiorica]
MRLLPSDPDIQTIVGRIRHGDIDLQPDFQRGEVWSVIKQQKLVDSVLRDWHVPPIHLVEHFGSKKTDVLDGQQRLVAICDFVDGHFPVNGHTEPYDERIASLDGLTYDQLPPDSRRQFGQFTIRMFRIVDFLPDEPAELFFRLNQAVALTSAEQRNAFFGPVRDQVKEIVDLFAGAPIGFSNSRMSYDDVVAKLCLSVEWRTIREKMSSGQLADKYRSREPFSAETMDRSALGVRCFARSAENWGSKVKLNKATLYSWFWLSVNSAVYDEPATIELLSESVPMVESFRRIKLEELPHSIETAKGTTLPLDKFFPLVQMYYDRSSSRVSDVSSVVGRDFFLWLNLSIVSSSRCIKFNHPAFTDLEGHLKEYLADEESDTSDLLHALLEESEWGHLA